ncbi:hypothetical protein C8R47DRAFT_588291 [Mycena vitilis]|nr:hypothetical protein C8R47DRAFT_588291 [Mycena vitilis]
MSCTSLPILPLEQVLDESMFDDTVPDDSMDVSPDPIMDQIYAALSTSDLSFISPSIDACAFTFESRLPSMTAHATHDTHMPPVDYLPHHTPNRLWSSLMAPTAPSDMPLRFVPVWSSPEAMDLASLSSLCVNPALLMNASAPVPVEDTVPGFEVPVACAVDFEDNEDPAESESEGDDIDVRDSDFVEPAKSSRARRPLPRRAKAKVSKSASRASASTPPSVASSSVVSISTSPSPRTSRKRAARSAAPSQRPTKKAAVSATPQPVDMDADLDPPAATDPSAAPELITDGSDVRDDLPFLPGINQRGLSRPANAGSLSESYYPFLRLGCTQGAGGVTCNIGGCKRTTKCFGDMSRHVPATHFRVETDRKYACDGCPRSFARQDSLARHNRNNPTHSSADRQSLLKAFNRTRPVIGMRAACASDKYSIMVLNNGLYNLFNKLLNGDSKPINKRKAAKP